MGGSESFLVVVGEREREYISPHAGSSSLQACGEIALFQDFCLLHLVSTPLVSSSWHREHLVDAVDEKGMEHFFFPFSLVRCL